jgi:PIN domain nuclease of toxin-antitoxin system
LSDSLLLDTSVVLWILEGSTRISKRASRALFDPINALNVSVVSVWEIILKHQAGKLSFSADLSKVLDTILHQSPWSTLALTADALRILSKLPLLHKDLFDRMLVAQALEGGFTLVTPDSHIREYDVSTLW